MALLAFLCLSVKAQSDTTKTSDWEYSSSVNEMTNDKSFYAQTISDVNDANLTLELLVRYSNKENEVIITIQNAIFDIQLNGINIEAKFDDGKIDKYGCTTSKTNMFTTIFVYREKTFIEKLKKSKKLFIQVDVSGHGREVFKFNTENLVWDH